MKEVHVVLFGKGELGGTHPPGSPSKRSSTVRPADKLSICTDDRYENSVFHLCLQYCHYNNSPQQRCNVIFQTSIVPNTTVVTQKWLFCFELQLFPVPSTSNTLDHSTRKHIIKKKAHREHHIPTFIRIHHTTLSKQKFKEDTSWSCSRLGI